MNFALPDLGGKVMVGGQHRQCQPLSRRPARNADDHPDDLQPPRHLPAVRQRSAVAGDHLRHPDPGHRSRRECNFDPVDRRGRRLRRQLPRPAPICPATAGCCRFRNTRTLFNLIGTTYGGDGQDTFALPDLQSRAIIGASSTSAAARHRGRPGFSDDRHGEPAARDERRRRPVPLENRQPSLALELHHRHHGHFPVERRLRDIVTTPYIGEVMAFAGDRHIPQGWVRADGRLLPIAQNQPLFALLGTTYGGDGRTTFALPDLRGRVVIGTGPIMSARPSRPAR